MVTFARREDIPQLISLWCTCFGDERAVAEYFYLHGFVPENTLVYREKTRILAMTTMFEVWLGGQKGYYIYAVATLPEARGRGLMTAIDRELKRVALERGGQFTCLIPANEPLFSMYKKLGYETSFYEKKLVLQGAAETLMAAERRMPVLSDCTEDAFVTLRQAWLAKAPNILSVSPDGSRFLYREWLHYGGKILSWGEGNAKAYVAYRKEKDGLYLKETTGDLKEAADMLLAFEQNPVLKTETPVWLDLGTKKLPKGMLRQLTENCSYFTNNFFIPMIWE